MFKELLFKYNDYANLRSHMLTVAQPTLPYLGLVFQDLLTASASDSDLLKSSRGNLINWRKHSHIAQIIQETTKFQYPTFQFELLPNYAKHLLTLKNYTLSSEEISNLSYKHEEKVTLKFSRVKLMLVGEGGVGKTTLVKYFTTRKLKKGFSLATDGIEIHDFSYKGVTFDCWDFAGQKLYHTTHQFVSILDSDFSVQTYQVSLTNKT
eukprot:TRINITY_DN15567_c0_g1_i1.p1 TRINITY_DN15567_c0_g1~~TRINITY_DN15567_c0_g1_i1.p1  ORF type:complete len:208 (+),score=18.65 TRINITY_DN15567_c0_g1_i1:57-680(+)